MNNTKCKPSMLDGITAMRKGAVPKKIIVKKKKVGENKGYRNIGISKRIVEHVETIPCTISDLAYYFNLRHSNTSSLIRNLDARVNTVKEVQGDRLVLIVRGLNNKKKYIDTGVRIKHLIGK